jgi:hypothetical protein
MTGTRKAAASRCHSLTSRVVLLQNGIEKSNNSVTPNLHSTTILRHWADSLIDVNVNVCIVLRCERIVSSVIYNSAIGGPTNTCVRRAVLVDSEHLSCPESHPFQRLFSLTQTHASISLLCLVIVSTCA